MRRAFYRTGCFTVILLLACAVAAFGQAAADKKPEPAKAQTNGAASSAAYAEVLLKKTELQSEVESLALEYTEEFPKVKEIRHVLGLVDRDIARLAKVKPTEASKLTLALGRLIVRRIELETDVWNLQRNYKDEHPDVKRAKRKVEIYENAISEILN
jgi:hypothetical protein